jgi:thimet oligopeptidase
MFGIIPGKQTNQGYQLPHACLVTNFPRPAADKPSLLPHSDVVTMFHEFGHLLHDLLTKAPYSAQAGTSTVRDFVEVPSQILENWAWQYDALELFAKHYDTGEILPKKLFDKMVKAKNVGSGLFTLQQIFYGMLDLTYHDKYDPSTDTESTTDILKELQNEITYFDYMEGTYFQAGFGHLVGYAAGYYGYLWAKVYAEDMFARFLEKGVLDSSIGQAFKEKVLERGSSVKEKDIVHEFLGREAKYDAFLKSLGL